MKQTHANKHQVLIGSSRSFQQLRDTILSIASTSVDVFIRGETGSGKDLVAREIHRISDRRDEPFIKINCTAIPDGLLETELFGYEEGAFTGTVKKKPGKFELADGGTLFLDEVGDLQLGLQAKLLQVLEEKQFYRVGGNLLVSVDVRVITATNKDLEKDVRTGRFRKDLFYRLNVIPLYVPSLRERREDILPLVTSFLEDLNKQYGKAFDTITSEVLDIFSRYDFPGNVRELKHDIERIVATTSQDSTRIEAHHLSHKFKPKQYSLKEFLQETEKKFIADVLEEQQGNISATARVLQVDVSNLHKKLKKFCLI